MAPSCAVFLCSLPAFLGRRRGPPPLSCPTSFPSGVIFFFPSILHRFPRQNVLLGSERSSSRCFLVQILSTIWTFFVLFWVVIEFARVSPGEIRHLREPSL